MAQFAVRYLVHLLFNGSYNLYDQFGIELAIGFVGDHGTAGTLGSTLKELNFPYWELLQGVATTTATFGIVGGILIGILLINRAARSGRTALLDKPADIPTVFLKGYDADITKHHSMGRETTQSSSVDALAFHIDGTVKSHITGSFTEFAVTGAVASLPIKAVAAYIVPIIVMCFIGYIVTTGWLLTMFITIPTTSGVLVTALIAGGISIACLIGTVIAARVCFGKVEKP